MSAGRDVDALRKQWRGPLVIKGLLHPDDAREAISRGADGVIVSNHGGRQLDGAVATIRALPGGGRGGRRASAGPDRRRLPPRRRRRQGAGARRARGADRPPAPLGRRLRGRGRRVLGARPLPARDRSRARARRLGRDRQARPEHLLSKPLRPRRAWRFERFCASAEPNGRSPPRRTPFPVNCEKLPVSCKKLPSAQSSSLFASSRRSLF